MDKEFCPVTRKKWMAPKSLQRRTCRVSDKAHDKECPDVDMEKFLKRLEVLREQTEDSDYFTGALQTLKEALVEESLVEKERSIKRLVCFGLGPFSRNFQALHQLAFILSLQKHFTIAEALYYDPVFNTIEKDSLEKLNCLVMSENCEAKYEADIKTFFFLPHCPNCLANNLLWKNWQPKYLKNIILINNSFETVSCSKPERFLRLDASFILDIMPFAKELPLDDDDYEVINVFNDLSVHVFVERDLPASDSDFWKERKEPLYNNVEMITANKMSKLSLV